MGTFTHGDRRYEVLEFGPVEEPGLHYELWDLTPESGMVGRIVVPDDGAVHGMQIDLTGRCPLASSSVGCTRFPELCAYATDPSTD
jgi:hypothetical protein